MPEFEAPTFHTDIFNANAFIPKSTLTIEEAINRFVQKPTLTENQVPPTDPVPTGQPVDVAMGE